MLAGAELDEERKIPLKLSRRGDLGGESWREDGGRGKMRLGELGLILGNGDATGVHGWLAEDLTHELLVGLGEPLLSPFRISSLSDLSVSPSIREDAYVLKSGMFNRRDRFFFEDFFAKSFFLESITVLPILSTD